MSGTLRRLSVLLALALVAGAATGAERLHLLIPAGPGGGLDATARAIGATLQAEDIRAPVSYENMTGGGGGRALGHFVETAERQQQALLVNSTPLIVRSLQGLFPHGFRDVVPVAALVAEYNAIAVRADSPIDSWATLTAQLTDNPGALIVGGGSVRGSLDHIVAAQALSASGVNARRVRYLPYDGGGKAMLALLGGEIEVLSTGFGETLGFSRSGDVRVLAVTAPARLPQLPGVSTLEELGTPVVFANWRGLFAPPGTSPERRDELVSELARARATAGWQEALERYGWSNLEADGTAFEAFLIEQESTLKQVLTDLGFLR